MLPLRFSDPLPLPLPPPPLLPRLCFDWAIIDVNFYSETMTVTIVSYRSDVGVV